MVLTASSILQPCSGIHDEPRAMSSPASKALKARVCMAGGVQPQRFMDQLLSLWKPQRHNEHWEQCTKGSEVGSARWPSSRSISHGYQPCYRNTATTTTPPTHGLTRTLHGLTSLETLPASCPPPQVLGSASLECVHCKQH